MKKILIITGLFLFTITLNAQPPALPNFGNSCYVNSLLQSLYSLNQFVKQVPNLQFENDPAKHFQQLIVAFNEKKQSTITAALFYFYDSIAGMFKVIPTETSEQLSVEDLVGMGLSMEEIKQQRKIWEDAQKQYNISKTQPDETDPDPDTAKAIKDSIELQKKVEDDHKNLVLTIARAKNLDFDKKDENSKKGITASIEKVLTQFNLAPQQDAHEFLTIFMDKLRGENPENKTYKTITKLFFYTPQISLNNFTFNKQSTKNKRPLLILNIPTYKEIIVDKEKHRRILASLGEGLETYFQKEEIISNYGRQEKEERIANAPEILTISLNKFYLDQNLDRQKVTDTIFIPIKLDIKDYVVQDYDKSTNYSLSAAVLHLGTLAKSGHYIAYVKHNSLWYLCNDSDIREVNLPEVQQKINESGYLFFYTRTEMGEGPAPEDSLLDNLNLLKRRLEELKLLLQPQEPILDNPPPLEAIPTIITQETPITASEQNPSQQTTQDIAEQRTQKLRKMFGEIPFL